MTILIAKMIKRVFYDNESGCCWISSKAGNKKVLIQFNEGCYELPKILKTVEYKLVGFWRKTRNGGEVFEVERYVKIKKTTLAKAKAYDAHLN